MKISWIILSRIAALSESAYPRECCGAVVENIAVSEGGAVMESSVAVPEGHRRTLEVIPFTNIQDRMHEEDPIRYPQTSGTAYFADPIELIALFRSNRTIVLFYHSHIESPPYFSELDRRFALYDGEPAYPGVAYLIVSMRHKKACEYAVYEFAPAERAYRCTDHGTIIPPDESPPSTGESS